MPKPKSGKKPTKAHKGGSAGGGTTEVLVTTSHRGQVKEAAVKASPATAAPKEQDNTSQHGIKREQALKAAEALLKHYTKVKLEESKQKKQDLLATGWDYIHVQVGLSKMPERVSPKPVPISLPHPLYTADDDFAMCLIVKEDCKPVVKKALSTIKLTGVSEVIGLQELRTDYKEYQDRRKLRDAFDLFLVDDRITPMLGKALGKIFFSRKKQPVPVRLGGNVIVGGDASSVAKRIVTARERTYLYRSHGNCVAVRIARTDFSASAVADNVVEGVETIVKALPGKWKNVMSVSIKTPDSVALPVYNKMPTYLREKAMTEDEYVEVLLKEYEEEDARREKRAKKGEQKRKEDEGRQLRRDMGKLAREQGGDDAEDDDDDDEEEDDEEADEFSRPDKQLVLASGKEGDGGKEAKGKKRPVAAAVADKDAGRAKKVKTDAPLVTKKDKAEKVETIKPDTGKKQEKGQKGKKVEAAVKPKEKMQVVVEAEEEEKEDEEEEDMMEEDDVGDGEEEDEDEDEEGEDVGDGGNGEDDDGDEDELEEEELRNEILAQLKGVLGLRLGGMNGQQLGDDSEGEDDDDDDDDEEDEEGESDGDDDDDEEEEDDEDADDGGMAMAAIMKLLARRAAGGGDSELDGDSDEDEDGDMSAGDEDDAELKIFFDKDENDDGDVDDDDEEDDEGDEEEDGDDEEEEEDKPTLPPPSKPTRVVPPAGKKPGKPDKRSVAAPAPAPAVPVKATKQRKSSPQKGGKDEKSAKAAVPPAKSVNNGKGRDQAKAAGRGPISNPGEQRRKAESVRAEGGKGADQRQGKGDKPGKQGQGSKGAVSQVNTKAGAAAKPSNMAPASQTRGGANKPSKPQQGQGKQSATKQGKGKHR